MLCPAEFLDFGPEILTRDLAQAPQDTQSWTLFFFFFSPHMAGRMFSLILKLGKKAPKCLFFFLSTFACLDEPELNHVSKVQLRTLKIERGTAILVKSWPLGRPSLYNNLFSCFGVATKGTHNNKQQRQHTVPRAYRTSHSNRSRQWK